MSFFIKGKQLNSVKRARNSNEKSKKHKPNGKSKNEEITSSEDEDLIENGAHETYSSEDENETAQEKKVRLAKVYLEEIEKEERARLENKEVDYGVVEKILKEDYLKKAGKLRLTIAETYKSFDESNIKILKSKKQKNCITCMCVTSKDEYVFTGSKDGAVIKYSLSESKNVGVIPFVKENNSAEMLGHTSQILSMDCNDEYLAVGDQSKDIYIWTADTLKFVKKLTGHKGAITGLCFKKQSSTLYSCSRDRTVKVWNLTEMAYVETLYGHQSTISSIDTLYRDRVVTCGGRDLRVWKVTEESQLIFNGHLGNIDNVRLINEENFITGGDDGQINIWSIMRKKPLCIIYNAHGIDNTNQQPYWISAITSLFNTDLVASGSQDGKVKLWKLENNFKSCSLVLEIPVEGFVNSLNFTSDGSKLLIAISKEHKLGRWTTIKSARNCIMIVPLIKE